MALNENPNKYLGNELAYLRKVLEAESWSATGGSWTGHLEQEFCEFTGSAYAVAMNSGTATLHAALEACGVGPGDEVISPALTVIMDTTATLHANAIPVYADVDPKTFNIDPSSVEERITPSTKAILAVSLYGLPCDMSELRSISDAHGIHLIEDNAQCVLAEYKNRSIGSFGDVSSWSFENSKHLSAGEGGMVTTNSRDLAEKMRKLGGHGFSNLMASEGRVRLNQDVFQDPEYKRHDSLGYNYRMSEFTAAVALAQLERAHALVELRVKSANYFLEAIQGSHLLRPQVVPSDRTHTYFTLGLVFDGAAKAGLSWQEFRHKYIELGGDGIYAAWSVPYLEPLMANGVFRSRNPQVYEAVEYSKGLCPIAEGLQSKIMQFKTNYRDLDLAEAKADALKRTIDFFEK